MTCFRLIIIVLFFCICQVFSDEKDGNNIESDDINNAVNVNDSDDVLTNNDTCGNDDKYSELQNEVQLLKDLVNTQQGIIREFNKTLINYVVSCEEQGFIYDNDDENLLALTSAMTYDIPFIMVQVISARLPRKDSIKIIPNKKKLKKVKSTKKIRKKRYLHVVITMQTNGLFRLFDEYQNELYNFMDDSLINNNNDNNDINVNPYFITFSDKITYSSNGDSWFIVARNDMSIVNVYAVGIYRNYYGDILKNEYIDGHITKEQTLMRPNKDERKKLLKKPKKVKRKPKKTKKKENKKIEVKSKDDDSDGNGIDSDNENNEDNDSETTTDDSEDTMDDGNVVVTGVAIYHKQKRKNIVVSYSDGNIFLFKRSGEVTHGFKAPNKTINVISRTLKKLELIYATNEGFQFLKLPRLKPVGRFCKFPNNTIVTSMEVDKVSESIVYFTTKNGGLLIYNTKKKGSKMCKLLDSFYVNNDNSIINIETTEGHLLVSSSIGIHVYNASWGLTYRDPSLLYVRKYSNDFAQNTVINDNNIKTPILMSSYTDQYHKTVIAYAQSTLNNNNINNDNKYGLIILESELPYSEAKKQKGGILGIFQKAPLFVGVFVFLFFFVFNKKGSGGGGSPLGKLGSLFFGGNNNNRRRHRSSNYNNIGPRNSPPNYNISRNTRYAAKNISNNIKQQRLPSDFMSSLSHKNKPRNTGKFGF